MPVPICLGRSSIFFIIKRYDFLKRLDIDWRDESREGMRGMIVNLARRSLELYPEDPRMVVSVDGYFDEEGRPQVSVKSARREG